MKIREEEFDEADIATISVLYKNHISSYWKLQAFIVFFALVSPYLDRNRESFFSEEFSAGYWHNVLISLIVMTIIGVGYFYYAKRSLRRDLQERIKEVFVFEVLNRERLFQDNTFYIYTADNGKEAITEELYEMIAVGDEVLYYKAKYSGELLSITARN